MNGPIEIPIKKRAWWKDALERVLWTAAEAAIAALIVIIGDIPNAPFWIPTLTAILAAAKTWVASRIGNKNTAAIGGNG